MAAREVCVVLHVKYLVYNRRLSFMGDLSGPDSYIIDQVLWNIALYLEREIIYKQLPMLIKS